MWQVVLIDSGTEKVIATAETKEAAEGFANMIGMIWNDNAYVREEKS